MVVYLITDTTNGKQYVGQTIHSAEQRFSQHCKPSETNCRLLNLALQAHGAENFTVSVLETVESPEELDEREIFWIKELNTLSPNGYNLKEGGQGKSGGVCEETRRRLSLALKGKFAGENNPFFGQKHTPESLEKMRKPRQSICGQNNPNYGGGFSEEHRRKLSAAKSGENHPWYGKHLPEETRRKIGEKSRGRKLSPEARAKISAAKLGTKASEETKQKLSLIRKGKRMGSKNPSARAVICVETGEIFGTIKEAAEHIGVWPDTLNRHLLGKQTTCRDKHWRYLEEVEENGD